MIVKLNAEGLELTPELQKYSSGKLARLRRCLPRNLRAAAVCDVHFKQVVRKDIKINTCTIKLKAGSEVFDAAEATPHMYAALDVVAVDLEQQLRMHFNAHHRLLPHRRAAA